MGSHYRRNRCAYGGSRMPALVALLLVAGGCVLAYRHFFQRQGEAATNLIPADAAMVVTLDLKPSPEQVPTFRRLHDAMQREEVEGQFDNLLTTLISNSPIGKDLRPYVTNSLAYAALKADGPGNSAPFASVGLFAVSDAGRVRDILTRDARKTTQDRLEYYQVKPGDDIYMTVVGDYFVVANKPAALVQIVKVHRGDAPAVTSLPAYQHARQALPADANLMLFITPETVQQVATSLGGQQRNGAVSSIPWVAVGMAARANGIDTYVQAPIDAPVGSDLSHITPLDMRLLKRLPGGAYGLMAFSQPGKYWSRLETAGTSAVPLLGGDSRQTSHNIDAGLARFERETGMSVPRDVLPSFYGHTLCAIYPTAAGNNANNNAIDADGLILIDAANGAAPAALADKVRAYIERQSAAHDRPALRFTSSSRDGATLWTLETEPRTQVRHNLKELICAQVGHAVLIASSQRMMDRALDTYLHGNGALADDPAYAQMIRQAPAGTQSLLLVNLPGILQAFRPQLANSMRDSNTGITADDIVRLFGQNTGIVGAQQYDGRVIKGYFFLPLDYEKVIRLIGLAHQANGGIPAASPPTAALSASAMGNAPIQ